MNKFKKDDTIIVTTGKDSGKTGKILKVFPKNNTILVEGINKGFKHTKPTQDKAGGIIEKDMPIHISNLSFYDSQQNKGVKIGYKLIKDKKVRINKSTGEEIK